MARSVYATASSAPVCGHADTAGPDRKEKPVKTKTRTTPMGEVTRVLFVSKLGGYQLARYSDGGGTDHHRARRRAAGKRQRAARRIQRSGR